MFGYFVVSKASYDSHLQVLPLLVVCEALVFEEMTALGVDLTIAVSEFSTT